MAGAGVELIRPFIDLLADEINVKSVSISDDVERYGSFQLRPNGRVLGPKLGPDVQLVIKAAKAREWQANDDGSILVAGHTLIGDEFELGLDPLDGVTAAALPGNDAVVVLDTNLTPELMAEGMARDLVRHVQQLRKERGLSVTDRILLSLDLSDDVRRSLDPHLDWIASQVLAVEVAFESGLANSQDVGGQAVAFNLKPVAAGTTES